MEEKFYPRLCGGTFFTLLVERARRMKHSPYGGRNGLNESEMLASLIRIFDPDFNISENEKRSFSTVKSNFKKCTNKKSIYLPFDDETKIKDFNALMKGNYPEALRRMNGFLNEYFELDFQGVTKTIVAMFLDLISMDESISDDDVFYAGNGGDALSKSELMTASKISFQPFILGVYHFVLNNRKDNSVGARTFDEWHNQPSGRNTKREFVSGIGRRKFLEIGVVVLESTDIQFESNILVDQNGQQIKSIEQNKKTTYLFNLKNKYKTLKTLLYNDSPRSFYDFYVCNDIRIDFSVDRPPRYAITVPNRRGTISNSNEQKLVRAFGNYIMITGTGGLGKSMYMRHLLLDAIDHYSEYKLLPIFVALKDYEPEKYNSLFDFIYTRVVNLSDVTREELKETLAKGEALILLDGLDELNSKFANDYEEKLEAFTDKYSSNIFVMSSRPYSSFISFSKFTILRLCPFTKSQALELIDKLEFRDDEPQIKEKFREQLDTKLYETHKEFTENPLLLTIMLMTFEQFAEVPSKMHIFYREAYLALSQKHDASKGAYKRALKTGLSADRFSDYFAEFCSRTYCDEKYELTPEEFEIYFNKLSERKRFDNEKVMCTDFKDDLISGMCLMFYEGGKYLFTHRSFQEYFCASYFSRQKDRNLPAIGRVFEHRSETSKGDQTFAMLYDMIPNKVEEYIFIPFLQDIFEKNYNDFVKTTYKKLSYSIGHVPFKIRNCAHSFLYNFIDANVLRSKPFTLENMPMHKEFVVDEFVDVENRNGEIEAVPAEFLSFENDNDEPVKPDGWRLILDTESVYKDPEKYQDIVDALSSDNCPIKTEYKKVKKYYMKLLKMQKQSGDDLFDMFN